MFLKFLLRKKTKALKAGDVVVVKSVFLNKFPVITKTSLLTVEDINNEMASVIFMNDTGSKIIREKLPLIALKRVA